MGISREALQKFQRLWATEFGETITLAEAEIQARRLFAFLRFLGEDGGQLSTDPDLTDPEPRSMNGEVTR